MKEAVGFDVGGTHVRSCPIWEVDGTWKTGDVRKFRWRHGDVARTPADLGRALSELRSAAVEASPISDDAAIGIGIAAQLDRSGERVLNAPNIGWRDVPLVEDLADFLPRRPRLINDVDAILVGERAFGAAQGVDDVLAVFVGTGVGGAIIAGGNLIRGTGGTAGEIGHVKVHGLDAMCGCGERGCIEAIAGGASLIRRMKTDGETASVTETDLAYARGEEYARRLWTEVSDALGEVVAGAATILNPALVLFGGGVFERAPNLGGLVEARAHALTLEVSRNTLRFVPPELGDLAGPLGAAIHACEH